MNACCPIRKLRNHYSTCKLFPAKPPPGKATAHCRFPSSSPSHSTTICDSCWVGSATKIEGDCPGLFLSNSTQPSSTFKID